MRSLVYIPLSLAKIDIFAKRGIFFRLLRAGLGRNKEMVMETVLGGSVILVFVGLICLRVKQSIKKTRAEDAARKEYESSWIGGEALILHVPVVQE